jgi:uncharacterized protein (DUF2164 family)
VAAGDRVVRIRLADARRAALVDAVRVYFRTEFDEELSEFRAEGIVDLFIAELGPPVYNQGVRDASAYVAGKLQDIEGEIFEPEPTR